MSSSLRTLLCLALSLTVFACSSQKTESMTPQANAAASRGGEKLYRRYCGACHGLEAKGDGIVSSLMTPKPRNLTTLKRDFGTFPREWLVRVIDGRETVRAHGESNMPVWGANLCTELGSDVTDAEVKNWIETIVAYLKEVQVE